VLDRLVITFIIVGGLGLLWLGWHYYKTRLVRAIQPAPTGDDKPTLLYFTAGYCTACKYRQAPIIQGVAANLGNAIAVKKVDVTQHPDVAGRYKVLTLPTTVVLNPQGRVAHLNYGVTQQARLEAQLSTLIQNNNLKQGLLNELQHAS